MRDAGSQARTRVAVLRISYKGTNGWVEDTKTANMQVHPVMFMKTKEAKTGVRCQLRGAGSQAKVSRCGFRLRCKGTTAG